MSFLVRWGKPAGVVDLSGYNVYRSQVSDPQKREDWGKLNEELVQVLFFKDGTARRFPQLTYYYRVTWEDSLGVESSLEDAISIGFNFTPHSSMEYVLEEIKRRHEIVLERGGLKEQVDIYVEKRAGEVCECWDEGLKRSTRGEACPDCFGKGFAGGFILISNQTVKIYSPLDKIAEVEGGLILQRGPVALLSDYPLLGKGDLLVLRNGDRYMVGDVMRRIVSGVILFQRATVVLLPSNHILQQVKRPS